MKNVELVIYVLAAVTAGWHSNATGRCFNEVAQAPRRIRFEMFHLVDLQMFQEVRPR